MSGSRRWAGRVKRRLFAAVVRVNLIVLGLIRRRCGLAAIATGPVAATFGLVPGDPVLVLAPHPDDEALGMGATLSALQAEGVQVHVALITDGGLSKGGVLRELTAQQRGQVRHEEFTSAMAVLCSQARLSGPYRPEVPGAGWQEDAELHEALRAALGSVRPKAIFAPPSFDYHPDHRAAAALAQVLAGGDATVFHYEVQAPLPCDGSMLVPDLPTEAQAARKRALALYVTQVGSVRLGRRLAAYRGRLAGRRAEVEAFLPADSLSHIKPLPRGIAPNPLGDLRLLLRRLDRRSQ